MTTLQRLVFPNLDVPGPPQDMYLRLDEGAWADLSRGRVCFETGSVLSTDTFFNGLTVGFWKRHCDIRRLQIRFNGAGEFVARLGLHRLGQPSVWLAEHRVSMTEKTTCTLPVAPWDDIVDGMLFLHMRALGPAVLAAADFVTDDPPRNTVRLGLVITHFNRQAQVLPAIDRIRTGLLDRPSLQGCVTLTVVDNSCNLPLAPHPAIAHLPNRNLGGTGGFTRGLISLMDDGHHTHALFMDDDASCEVESIARSLAVLRYARRKTLSIAGALLRELAPWELVEKGARFRSRVMPLKGGLDMRRVIDLLEAEREVERPDYGAWWFFAFPLSEVRSFPFPFFVRGDDIFFGLRNRFEIVTLNGVACVGEDFSSKHGPMTAYLDARYHLIHALLRSTGSRAPIWWVGRKLFLKPLTGYLYSSAHAVTVAMQHVAEGPEFFRRHIDMTSIRSTVGTWSPTEKLLPIDRAALEVKAPRRSRESAARRIFRALSLQGFLLPDWMIKNRTTLQPKDFHGRASSVFRYRNVLYEHAQTGTGFIATFDRGRFFSELAAFLKAWSTLLVHAGRLRREYAAGVDTMSTLAFWRAVYAEKPGTPQVPSSPELAPLDDR